MIRPDPEAVSPGNAYEPRCAPGSPRNQNQSPFVPPGPAVTVVPGPHHPLWPPVDFSHGEYVDRPRLQHVPTYRLRVDDLLEFVYRVTRIETAHPYQLQVGDQVRIESIGDATLNRDLVVQPDGTITLRLLGQVRATRKTVQQLREELEQAYTRYLNVPGVTVTPLQVNTRLEDLRAAVNSQFAGGGQTRQARVTPEGTIQLPAIGSVFVQGMTLDELNRELNFRYAQVVDGLEITSVLLNRAPRFVYVLGEVRQPGRYVLEGPTSAMQAISLAGGWNVGANLRQVVVFRRDDNWRLMATLLHLWNPLYGNTPHAPDDIWLGDSDVVVVPKMKILVADEFIDMIFTRGIYGVFPFNGLTLSMSKLSTL
jgi:polysaccharide export outer membrane protein